MATTRALLSLAAMFPASFVFARAASAQNAMKPVIAHQAPQQSARQALHPVTAPATADATQYCAAIAGTAVEVRIAWEMQRLKQLEADVQKSTERLHAEAAEARSWVEKRQQMRNEANEAVVAIFNKMPAEAASSELAAMDEQLASAILGKLNPRVASGILSEMDSGKAARLNGLMMTAPDGKKT